MISMIRILTRVAPGNVHLASGQIDDHGGNGALAVQGIDACNVVIADRVRQIDVILLDRLQGLDRVRRILS